jgi:uncharacterized phage protein gp47/JayE
MAVRTNYTFSEIYDLMRNKINEFSSNKPTFWGQGSIARAFVQALAYFSEFIQLQINIAYQSFTVKHARGIHLYRRMEDFRLTVNEASNAISVQSFLGEAGRTNNIIITQGTMVQTSPDIFGNILQYQLINDITLTSGVAEVTGYCACTQVGSIGNVPSGVIVEIPTQIAGVSGTINYSPVSSGNDLETDEQLKARLPAHLNGLKKGNRFAIESACYAVNGITYVKILENHPSQGNFTAYVSTESGYVDNILIAEVQQALSAVAGFCVTYSIIVPTIENITIEMDCDLDTASYDADTLKLQIQLVLKDYINLIRRNDLFISDVILLVRALNGVLNVKNVLINGVADDLSLLDLYVAKINDISDITVNEL